MRSFKQFLLEFEQKRGLPDVSKVKLPSSGDGEPPSSEDDEGGDGGGGGSNYKSISLPYYQQFLKLYAEKSDKLEDEVLEEILKDWFDINSFEEKGRYHSAQVRSVDGDIILFRIPFNNAFVDHLKSAQASMGDLQIPNAPTPLILDRILRNTTLTPYVDYKLDQRQANLLPVWEISQQQFMYYVNTEQGGVTSLNHIFRKYKPKLMPSGNNIQVIIKREEFDPLAVEIDKAYYDYIEKHYGSDQNRFSWFLEELGE